MEIYLKNCKICIYDKIIIEDATVSLLNGGFYRVSGPNGSGKTVFLNTILALNKHIEGDYKIIYDKKCTSYIPANQFFLDSDSVEETLNTLCFFYNISKTDLNVPLGKLDMDYSEISQQKINELSTGMKKKLCVLPLFFENIEFYVLDEIFSGLDLNIQNVLKDRLIELNSQRKTILIVEHNEDIIEDLKNYIVMEEFECKQKILK